MLDSDEDARTAAVDVARRLVPYWKSALGKELLGVYLIGSLAHAGFNRRYSDVDLVVITEAGLPQAILDGARGKAAALSTDWGSRLSVFWTDRKFSVGRFPPLDRIDFLDHSVVLMESERMRPVRPSLDEIRDYLRGSPYANWTDSVRHFRAAERLEPKDRKAFLRTLIYPGRFYYSWITGRIGSNDDAVAFLNAARPARLDIGLIKQALLIRQAAADPDSLFSARTMLASQVDACTQLLADRNASLQNSVTATKR